MDSPQIARSDGALQIQAVRPGTTDLRRPIYALQEEDGAPGLYKLLICDFENTNDPDRPDTPPPSYHKYELPVLRLAIPTPDTGRLRSSSPHTDDSQESQTSWSELQYVPRTFLEQNRPKSEDTQPSETDSSKNTKNLLARVRWMVQKREKGIKIRTKRPDEEINRKVSAVRLERISVTVPPSPAEKNSTIINGSPEVDHSSVFELDGQPIPSSGHKTDSKAYSMLQTVSTANPETNMEVLNTVEHDPILHPNEISSIVPTPKRGLSLIRPEGHSWSSPIFPEDLKIRLKSITRSPLGGAAVPISPLSPTSPGLGSPLRRSNAFSDHHGKPGNLQGAADECQTSYFCPTLKETSFDAPHRSLPKLIVPINPSFGRNSGKQTTGSMAPRRSVNEDLDDDFSGKEVIVSPNLAEECNKSSINLSVSMPCRGEVVENSILPPETSVDSHGKYPEVVSSQMQPAAFHSMGAVNAQNNIYHRGSTKRYYKQANPIVALIAEVSRAFLDNIIYSVSALRDRYGPEPPVPDGHVRVRWTCSCGEHLYDDYQENRSGAAAELQAHLNRVPYQTLTGPPSSHPSSDKSSIFSANSPCPPTPQSSWSSPTSNTPSTPWSPPDFAKQPAGVTTNTPFNVNFRPYIEPLWLFTCLNEGKWSTKLRHLDVNSSKITSDKDLALALSGLYKQVNRKWYKFLKLRGLTNIRFVQFELHRNRYADISRVPALPEPGTSDYEFQSSELMPPVGSTYLMHLFKHPEDYDDELITYLRTPKRRVRLEVGIGWGLQLVEGFLPERVWALILGLFGLASLVFAVVWTVMKDDVQGAFGIAGWMLTAAALVIAWVQTWVD